MKDAINLRGDTQASSVGKHIVLPSSFTNGPRYFMQNYQNAMIICWCAGYPDLIIIFTCNSKWSEISYFLKKIPSQQSFEHPDIIFMGLQNNIRWASSWFKTWENIWKSYSRFVLFLFFSINFLLLIF